MDESVLRQQARSRQAQWQSWLAPISDAQPTGDDPGYDDDFQRIRDEVNKISGVDTELICQLAGRVTGNNKRYPDCYLLLLGPFAPGQGSWLGRWAGAAGRLAATIWYAALSAARP
ncbi:type VI secretion system ImpA family N-terminal domain-containing protein [Klebsiella pneumoniae subsp. pneumoniae]|nr:type VI secretion system ImpA family N-terminal domain-containing protein [Klebsiella pneumoniae subsp. pneumoniae]